MTGDKSLTLVLNNICPGNLKQFNKIVKFFANYLLVSAKAPVFTAKAKEIHIKYSLCLIGKNIKKASNAFEITAKPSKMLAKGCEIIAKAFKIIAKGNEMLAKVLKIHPEAYEMFDNA